ncbi:MAG: hypothetical protein ACSLEN_03905 [Candidatus Malihini olakiniferum]
MTHAGQPVGVALSLRGCYGCLGKNGCNKATLAEIVGASRTAGLIAARIGVELSAPGVTCRRVIHQ